MLSSPTSPEDTKVIAVKVSEEAHTMLRLISLREQKTLSDMTREYWDSLLEKEGFTPSANAEDPNDVLFPGRNKAKLNETIGDMLDSHSKGRKKKK